MISVVAAATLNTMRRNRAANSDHAPRRRNQSPRHPH